MKALAPLIPNNKETWTKIINSYPEIDETIGDLPSSVGGNLKAHMDRLDVTVEELENLSGVSERTIKKIRNNNGSKIDIRFYVAICLGLNLEPPYSIDLLHKTRYQLNTDKESTVFLMLLTTMYQSGIKACNEEMIRNGLDPLT